MNATAFSRTFLREIRIEHTLFALPFAYAGAIFAAQGIPAIRPLFWITVAVLGARTAAMAANRYLDREIDARNPRTASRALATGTLAPAVMLWAAAAGLALLGIAAWQLNPLCLKLLPLAALGAIAYPLCKRFTWATHLVLGAVDALAPLGAFIAVRGSIDGASLLLFGGVTLWVAGFDIVYALMDLPYDRDQRIRSMPAHFGEWAGRSIPLVMHGGTLVLLAIAGLLAHAGYFYALGIIAMGALLLFEEGALAAGEDVFTLNDRIFKANMIFSVVFLVTTALSFSLA